MARLSKAAHAKKTLSPIAVIVALALALCATGTMAYLTATSFDANVFALGGVDVSLSETPTGKDDESTKNVIENEYLIEKEGDGWRVIAKDPTVTVAAGSADCWLFVVLDESENFDNYLSYQVIEGWKPLCEEGSDAQVTTQDGAAVWYREVAKSDAERTIYVLAGGLDNTGAVTVNSNVTEAQVRALGTATNPNPTLSITVYAVQKAGLDDPTAAWALAGV